MKRVILLLVVVLLVGCSSDVVDPSEVEEKIDTICCESFGYGSMMVKCCEEYEWTELDECVVEEDFVGGGKQVVSDSYCSLIPIA